MLRPSRPSRMPIIPRSSYYNPDYTQGAALARARKPYLIKNLVTGACLTAFVGAIYAYTLKAVSQDNFEDVVPPPEPTGSNTNVESANQ